MKLPEHDTSKVVSLFELEREVLLPQQDKMKKLTSILTRFYQDPFIWVQELLSNAIDSHTEAGVTEKVIMSINHVLDEYEVCFSDFGLGMNPERVKFTYTFLESSKEDSNEYIGGYGLGSKSPFAYTNAFLVETVSDGIFYTYLVSKETGLIEVFKLLERPTTERNQTHVKVSVKQADIHHVVNTAKNRCGYIEGVHFDYYDLNDLNSSKIVKHPDFYIHSNYDKNHLIVGQVKYPIPANCISLNYTGVGLYFKVGEVIPSPTREYLEETPELIAIVDAKIKKVNEILDGFRESQEVITDDLVTFLEEWENRNRIKVGSLTVKSNFVKKVEFSPCPWLKGGWDFKNVLGDTVNYFEIRHQVASKATPDITKKVFYAESRKPRDIAYAFTQGYRGVVVPNLSPKKRQRPDYQLLAYLEKTLDRIVTPKDFVWGEKKKKVEEKMSVNIVSQETLKDLTISDIRKLDKKVIVGLKKFPYLCQQFSFRLYFPFVEAVLVSKPNYDKLISEGFEDIQVFFDRMKYRIAKRYWEAYPFRDDKIPYTFKFSKTLPKSKGRTMHRKDEDLFKYGPDYRSHLRLQAKVDYYYSLTPSYKKDLLPPERKLLPLIIKLRHEFNRDSGNPVPKY